ncbi:MAG: prolyl-tRNA synthetase associated domain-containing protein [Neisseriaceae bacterium]|nr:prolyl-tRNA synthetase associated domain-containing protein [Neisseriaceae bacterium]MBP6863127.1 prolyl-tRNA synthetase associated domain-containing protein [Neisseriaceae bacterium]
MTEQSVLTLLTDLGIDYVRVTHPALGAIDDYYKMNIELPDQGIKNLFLRNKKGNRMYLVVMDEHQSADLAHIAAQIGESRLSFASEEKLKQCLNVAPGCVTPFALPYDTAQKVTVLLDQNIKQDELLGFHPLVNDATVCIGYADFLRFLAHTQHEPRVIRVQTQA